MSDITGKLPETLSATQEAARQIELVCTKGADSVGAAARAISSLELGAGTRGIFEDFERTRDAMRGVWDQFEDLRRSGALESVARTVAEASRASEALTSVVAGYRLPDFSETTRLFQQLENSQLVAAIRQVREHGPEIQKAIEAMNVPWLDIQRRLDSFGGFAKLQGIGTALRNLPAFDEKLVGQIRSGLGDWRDAITWPDNIFSDTAARSAFYVGKGFDPLLTDFPEDAFGQSMRIAGLAGTQLPFLSAYAGELDEEEAGFARTNAAHKYLLRFETHLRKFIEENMRAVFGEDWIKQRVPGDVWRRWHEKREFARERGEPAWPLIAYADFADYVPIMTRRDNWDAVFKPVFRRAEFVTESFQRLYPIRICTMHARLITQDDELYMYVEIKRLLSAIGIEL